MMDELKKIKIELKNFGSSHFYLWNRKKFSKALDGVPKGDDMSFLACHLVFQAARQASLGLTLLASRYLCTS
jgi:hypothetical protein